MGQDGAMLWASPADNRNRDVGVADMDFRPPQGGSNRAARYVLDSWASMAYFGDEQQINLGAIHGWMENAPWLENRNRVIFTTHGIGKTGRKCALDGFNQNAGDGVVLFKRPSTMHLRRVISARGRQVVRMRRRWKAAIHIGLRCL